jgi:hypothetical protein
MADERTPNLTLIGVLLVFLDPSYQYWCIKVRAWITWRRWVCVSVGLLVSCARSGGSPRTTTHHRHVCRLFVRVGGCGCLVGVCAISEDEAGYSTSLLGECELEVLVQQLPDFPLIQTTSAATSCTILLDVILEFTHTPTFTRILRQQKPSEMTFSSNPFHPFGHHKHKHTSTHAREHFHGNPLQSPR